MSITLCYQKFTKERNMGFIKNFIADRNAGKLNVERQRVEDIKNEVKRPKKEQAELEKHLKSVGIRENRQKRYNTSMKPTVDNSTRYNTVNVGSGNTKKTGLNDSQVAIANKQASSKSQKTTKSKTKKKK